MSSCASTPTSAAAGPAVALMLIAPRPGHCPAAAAAMGAPPSPLPPADSPRSSASGGSSESEELDSELYRSDAFMLNCFK